MAAPLPVFSAVPAGNARMVEKLRERTGATVVSTAGAMIEALRSAGVTETAVVTPYLQPVNDGLRHYLESSGIAVETLNSFFCKTTAELGADHRRTGARTRAANRDAAEQEPVCRLLAVADAECDRAIARASSTFPSGRRSRQRHGPAPGALTARGFPVQFNPGGMTEKPWTT